MKKIFTAAALSAAIMMASCGGGSTTDKPAAAATPNPGKMNDLMTMLDGNQENTKKVVETYFSDSLKSSMETGGLSFADYSMKDAKVVSVEGQCCTMEAAAGVTTHSFKLCWQGDKVTGVQDLGIK